MIEQIVGRSYYKIEKVRYDDEALAAMSADELKILKSKIEMKAQIVAAQLKVKKIEYANGGEGATREWYNNHKYVLRVCERMIPFLADLIKKRNTEERSISDYFLDEARIYLDKEVFDTIMQNAMREKRLLSGK
jgi:hypothetical protein